MTDEPSLDNILSTRGQEPVQEKPQATPEQPTRTESAPAEQQEAVTTEATQQEEQPVGQRMVPHEALHAEKQKVKRYTEQIASFEETIKARDEAWDRRFNQLLEKLTPAQQAEQQQQVDWFADPDAAFRQRGEMLINPVAGDLQAIRTELAQMKAERVFGEKFGEFMSFIKDAHTRGDPEVRALEAMMNASPNPYGVAKEWYEKRTFDPNAERERIKAELLAEMQSPQQEQPQGHQPPPVMPTNMHAARNVGARSGPAWSGPPPLQSIFDTRRRPQS